ncbi:parB-like partition protein [Ruminiclostridium cellulolyticum H10]|uniref:ParB-like partition protein n=2 Tax=Ruminiclostridium cellulolyticum TaxID=1521 RepID=B8I139_RUMCH|nr:parB-like partition protein [Ruminiclostridium cellulolyticum H10]
MIQNININKLKNHPKNPRKELGDLTELAESIKTYGVFQNLTVVPWFCFETGVGADDPKQQEEMGYFVVIGNRRLAAAKLAGLEELPCVISDMDYKTQLATMLLENMQRNDLTIYEQAQGFQMMLDLGESLNDISEKTGLSETTVRRRVKLLEFDSDKFKKSVERGGTLMDYMELDKIQDIKLRNNVLDKIGTSNFKYELQAAIDKEKREKNKALWVAELNKFATQVKNSNGLQQVNAYYNLSQKPEITKPTDADTVEYFFFVSEYGSITLYKKSENNSRSTSDNSAYEEKQKRISEQRAALDEISKRAYQLRRAFVLDISNAKAKKNIGTIIQYSLWAMLDDYNYLDYEEFSEIIGMENDDENDEKDLYFATISEHVSTQPERNLLIATYLALDKERETYYGWNNQYMDNGTLNTVYNLLEKLGYEMSDEEKSMRDGTHELFENSEAEK